MEVRWSINAPVVQNSLEAGSTATINLTFSPSILQVTRNADGSITQTTSAKWTDHPVKRMRYCVALDEPCTEPGEMKPFELEAAIPLKLEWLGERKVYLMVEILDRDGNPVAVTDGWNLNAKTSGLLVMKQIVRTALNPATPLETLPSPILTTVAATRMAFPVTGSVKIEGSPCCQGGTAGSTIKLKVNFQASSSAGKVTEMRVGRMCPASPADLQADWEAFSPEQSIETTVPLNWTTFTVSVQYRDARGNLSSMYCDNLGIEGNPLEPTQTP